MNSVEPVSHQPEFSLSPVVAESKPIPVQPMAGEFTLTHRVHLCGIYQIRNVITNKRYIGRAKDVWPRIRVHLNDLRKGGHHCGYLQSSFDKHTEAMFKWSMLEICSEELLDERERHWISEARAAELAYNSKIPDKSGTWTCTEEIARIHSKVKKEAWSDPVFAATQQKLMWSDARKNAVRSDYLNRKLAMVNAAGHTFQSVSEIKEFIISAILRGMAVRKLTPLLGFSYKEQMRKFCKAINISTRALTRKFQDALKDSIASGIHVREMLSRFPHQTAHAIYQFAHRNYLKINRDNTEIIAAAKRRTGTRQSPEIIEKCRLARLGQKRSPEARENIRMGALRREAAKRQSRNKNPLQNPRLKRVRMRRKEITWLKFRRGRKMRQGGATQHRPNGGR